MTTYKVKSIFRDSKGRELRRSTTFHDEAPDAREALRCAHITMTPLVDADPCIDSISSTVTGGGETISTIDYADEIGCGISSVGLMNEITPAMTDAYPDIAARALDAVLTDEQKTALTNRGKTKAVPASGGGGVSVNVDDDADLFPAGTDGPPGLPAQARRQDPARAVSDGQHEIGGASVGVDPLKTATDFDRYHSGIYKDAAPLGGPYFDDGSCPLVTGGVIPPETWEKIRAVVNTGSHRDRLILGKWEDKNEQASTPTHRHHA